MPIRIMIVDDHPLVMEGLEQLLKLDSDFEVIAKCRTVTEGLRVAKTSEVDVVVLGQSARVGQPASQRQRRHAQVAPQAQAATGRALR